MGQLGIDLVRNNEAPIMPVYTLRGAQHLLLRASGSLIDLHSMNSCPAEFSKS
jgi:hypothetical protein